MSQEERSEKRHKLLGHFWVFNVLAVVLCYFFANEFWQQISVLYLVLVSLYANVATEYGNSKSAEAARVSADTWAKKFLRFIGADK